MEVKTTHKKSSGKRKPVSEGFIAVAGAAITLLLGLSLMAATSVRL